MREAAAGPDGDRQPDRAASGAGGWQKGTFGIDDLSAIRRLAAEHGRRAGLDSGRLGDFVLAVSEAAVSAICHGSKRGSLRLWRSGDDVCCEARGGRWMPAGQPSAVPDDSDSLRLWVVWQVCSEVDVSYGPDETIVRLSVRTR